MNREIKKVAYKILREDKLAREDDWYLIQRVLMTMLPCNEGTAFGKILQGMKIKGISFEAITRKRRKFLEENPEYKSEEITQIREKEEEEYFMEYANHVPRIDQENKMLDEERGIYVDKGKIIFLSLLENIILKLLIENKQKVVKNTEIYKATYLRMDSTIGSLAGAIHALNKKLNKLLIIKNHYGKGYRVYVYNKW